MAKKQKKPEEPAGESAPMWIVSFADLVTLMMSFFVVLYALKKGGSDSEAAMTAALVEQFSGEMPQDADNPAAVMFWAKRGVDITKERGRSDQTAKGADGHHNEVQTIRETNNTPTSGGMITFEFGKADLTGEAKETIGKLIPILQGHNAVLLVKGHVSGDEIANRPDDPYGLSLSQRRATVVVDELYRRGIERKLLRPVACGPYEPLKSGSYDPSDLQNNRRVEVFSTDTFASEYNPTPTVQLEGGKGEKDDKTEKGEKRITTQPASHGAAPASHDAPKAPAAHH